MWMPSVSWRDAAPARGRAMNFTAGAGIGSDPDTWMVVLGITAEFGLVKR